MAAYGALLISILFTVVSQILQKQVADSRAARTATGSAIADYLSQPRFWLALLCLGGAMLSWLLVLAQMEVSKAYSLLSVNYVLMLLVSRFLFRESIPARRWLGVACLLAGILLIAQS